MTFISSQARNNENIWGLAFEKFSIEVSHIFSEFLGFNRSICINFGGEFELVDLGAAPRRLSRPILKLYHAF